VGQAIGDQRRKLGMTQDELAAGSGIDSSNIRAYENGRAIPSIYSLVRIAKALDIDAGALLAGLTVEHFGVRAGERSVRRMRSA
jgi:transcriptional regulator with XRE-family HTH domain